MLGTRSGQAQTVYCLSLNFFFENYGEKNVFPMRKIKDWFLFTSNLGVIVAHFYLDNTFQHSSKK